PLVADVPTTVVANRMGDEPDHPGIEPAVRIPFDPAVADAERRGLAPLDACPGSPAVDAVAHLADVLRGDHEAGRHHDHDRQEVAL
ncbi:MAG: hypothetical protein M3P97_05170, partial [Actinomycetota bacterium]|nr:hypothetical protein [Actinomycetota bacterium]